MKKPSAAAFLACAVGALMIVQGNAFVTNHLEQVNADKLASAQRQTVRFCTLVKETKLMETYTENPTHKILTVGTPAACAPVLAGTTDYTQLSKQDAVRAVHDALKHSQLRELGQSVFADSFIDQVYHLDELENPTHKTQALTNLLDSMDTLLLNRETEHTLAKTNPTRYGTPDFKEEAKTLEDVNKALSALFAKEALNDLPHIQPSTQEAKATMAHLKLDPLSEYDVEAYRSTFGASTFDRLLHISAGLDRVQELHNKVSPPAAKASPPHIPYSTEYTNS